jgi:hypothetical protein
MPKISQIFQVFYETFPKTYINVIGAGAGVVDYMVT